jgi:hypothetical protein
VRKQRDQGRRARQRTESHYRVRRLRCGPAVRHPGPHVAPPGAGKCRACSTGRYGGFHCPSAAQTG